MSQKDRGKLKSFFLSRWFLIGAFLLLILVGFAFGRAYYQDYQVKMVIQQLQDEARQLEVKKLQSLEILKYVKSSEFAEAKARSELNMVKPGENTVVIPRPSIDSSRQNPTEMLKSDNLSNPQKWWRFFVGEE